MNDSVRFLKEAIDSWGPYDPNTLLPPGLTFDPNGAYKETVVDRSRDCRLSLVVASHAQTGSCHDRSSGDTNVGCGPPGYVTRSSGDRVGEVAGIHAPRRETRRLQMGRPKISDY